MSDQKLANPLAHAQQAMTEKRGRAWAFPAISSARTALIGCEISRLGLALAPKLRGTIPRIDWLARTLRAGGGLVFWSHFSKSAFDGSVGEILGDSDVAEMRKRLSDPSWIEVNEGVQGIEADRMVARNGYSALGPDLQTILKDGNIDTVLITGAETEGTVASTARAAVDAGLRVIVVGDCCVSSDDTAHSASLASLHRRFADVRTVDEVVAELRRNIAS